jgi:hypothetical protein
MTGRDAEGAKKNNNIGKKIKNEERHSSHSPDKKGTEKYRLNIDNQNPKCEYRNSKQTRNSNFQMPETKKAVVVWRLCFEFNDLII